MKAGGVLKVVAMGDRGADRRHGEAVHCGRGCERVLARLRGRWDAGVGFSLDLLGEACLSEGEAESYTGVPLPQDDRGHGGSGRAAARATDAPVATTWVRFPRGNLSVKISSLAAKADPLDYQGMLDRLMAGACAGAGSSGQAWACSVNFDMEQYALKDLTLDVFERCCEHHAFDAGLAAGVPAIGGGRRAADRLGEGTGRVVTVRLVKGAYWDYEMIHAERRAGTCRCVRPRSRRTRVSSDDAPLAGGDAAARRGRGVRSSARVAQRALDRARFGGSEQLGLPQ